MLQLAFTISRGMRSQTSITLGERKLDLAVSDMMSHANEIENAVSLLRRRDISEGNICFVNNVFPDESNAEYANIPGCSQDTNKLYHPSGGALSYRSVLEFWLDKSHYGDAGYGEWMFTNVNGVEGVGKSISGDPASMELIVFVPHIKEETCKAINDKLGMGQIIPENGSAFIPELVKDSFPYASGQINAPELEGKYSGCFHNTSSWDSNVFYQVLIER